MPETAVISFANLIEPPGARPVTTTLRESHLTALARAACRAALAAVPSSGNVVGLYLGVSASRAEFVERAGRLSYRLQIPDYCDSLSFTNSIASATTGLVAKSEQITGPSLVVNTGVLSAIDAIGLAHLRVASSDGARMLAGGVESAAALRWARGSVERSNGAHLRSSATILLLGLKSASRCALLRAYRSALETPASCLDAAVREAGLQTSDVEFAVVVGHADKSSAMRLRAARTTCEVICVSDTQMNGAASEATAACALALDALKTRSARGAAKVAAVVATDHVGQTSCLIFGH